MKSSLSILIFLLAVYCLPLAAQTKDYTRHVNPFIGTGGHGHTFPGATVPFGMVQLSPDTRIDNWDGSSGYHYSDNIIYGFSHTHLSGTGIPDGCDILLMPSNGDSELPAIDRAIPPSYASGFSHSNEKAEPGFYSVLLDKHRIFAELTATPRVGLHRYSFSKKDNASITLDLGWRDKVLETRYELVTPTRIEGFRHSSSWAKNQKVYFVLELSRPYDKESVTSYEGTMGPPARDLRQAIALRVKPTDSGIVLAKVAISYVSIEGARKNLEAELPHWDFDKVRADAKAAWNKELSKTEVSGGTPDQTTNFYTALYHTMIHPNVFNDVDGRYKGHDGKIHQLPGYGSVSSPHVSKGSTPSTTQRGSPPRPPKAAATPPQTRRGERAKSRGTSYLRDGVAGAGGPGNSRQNHYTVFSLWDTFRAAHPLYTIIDQKRTADFINTFIRIYEQGGRLPVWELWGEETDTMIGYHAVSVIADAMAKGIKGFDYDKAYQAAKHSAELDHHGLAAYKKRGYISSEDENESVSKTLEYAYNDWCLMKMGSLLYNMRSLSGKKTPADAAYLKILDEDVDRYRRRAGNFENLFDTETGFFRPKRNGGFIKPFAPQEVTFHFTEGNSWQYSFFAPHNIDRLMQLMGGPEKFDRKLDELFTTDAKLSGRFQPDITGLVGQYAHGNEPSHHIAYLYSYAGLPHKTQKRVRQIMDDFYKPTPDGLIGNEDCGQMSAWYVLSASGFYPVAPGDERYALGSPIFKEVTYNLENGKKFIVRAPGNSPSNTYIRSARWNGKRHSDAYINQYHIDAGGVLEFDMSASPNERAFDSFPSSSVFRDQAAVPVIEAGGRSFAGSTMVSMASSTPISRIHYTTDGSEPDTSSPVYTTPFRIEKTTTVRAFVVTGAGHRSPIAEAAFLKRANDWTATVTSGYSTQYSGGGDNAIVDGLMGTTNFASGEWQGVQGRSYEAVIDLRRETKITNIGIRFLQHPGVWIWAPKDVEYEVSMDGVNYSRVGEFKPGIPLNEMQPQAHNTLTMVKPSVARYVRVRAHNIGKIPDWHPGAGADPWIFVDEVIVR